MDQRLSGLLGGEDIPGDIVDWEAVTMPGPEAEMEEHAEDLDADRTLGELSGDLDNTRDDRS